jgi:hypothetical protein
MIVAEAVFYVAIAVGERQKNQDRTSSESLCPPTLSICEARYAKPFISTGTLEAAISEDLSTIPEVVGVSVKREDDNFLVLIKIAGESYPPRELRHKIYAKEFGLMEAFPEQSFDFNLA